MWGSPDYAQITYIDHLSPELWKTSLTLIMPRSGDKRCFLNYPQIDLFVKIRNYFGWVGALKGQGPQHPNLHQVHELLYSSPEIDKTVGNLKIVEKHQLYLQFYILKTWKPSSIFLGNLLTFHPIRFGKLPTIAFFCMDIVDDMSRDFWAPIN